MEKNNFYSLLKTFPEKTIPTGTALLGSYLSEDMSPRSNMKNRVMRHENFAIRLEIGRFYVFACTIYVAPDMSGACQTYKDF